MTTDTTRTVTSKDGATIAYATAGAGPPLVLVHGALSDRTIWVLVQSRLAERFTVHAVNRRGRAGSSFSNGHDLEREFEDVAAVIDAVGEPVHLLGHSSGALCSLGATLLTSRIRSLILYEPPMPGLRPPMADAIRKHIEAGRPDEAALEFLTNGPRVPAEQIAALKASPAWADVVALAPSLVAEVDAVGSYEFDARRFAGYAGPALLLYGGDSPPEISEVVRQLAGVWPNTRLEELPGQQHLAQLAAPDLFLSKVLGFLEGL